VRNGLTNTELGLSWILPRLVGASRAFELLFTGREIDAAEAERIGLVARVVPDEALLDEALALAARLCELSPHGVAMTKRVLWSNLETASLHAGMDLENRNQLLVRMTTGNLDEAIRARREGRKPRFAD
jgi:enoyl-CoA hydratase